MVARLRRDTLRAVGLRHRGCCTTTVIRLAYGDAVADPALSLPLATVAEWAACLKRRPGLVEKLRHVWPHIVRKLRVKSRWSRVAGPMRGFHRHGHPLWMGAR